MKHFRNSLVLLLTVLLIMTMMPSAAWAGGAAGEEQAPDGSSKPAAAGLPETESQEMPGAVFTGAAGGLSVEVTADEGAFPAGSTMRVTAVDEGTVLDAVSGAVEGEVRSIAAADISFFDTAGNEIEPALPVHVVLNHAMLAAECPIVHVDSGGRAERLTDVRYDTDNGTAVLESDQFSVYAVVDNGSTAAEARVEVHFKNGDKTIATVYVKNSDTAAELKQIVYDPGAGELASNQLFKGWYIDEEGAGPAYTADTKGKDIQQIRDYLETLEISEGDTLDIYAVILHVYHITFLDEDNAAMKTDQIVFKEGSAVPSYTINVLYTPKSQNAIFEGWHVKSGTLNAAGGVREPYPNGTSVTLGSDVQFSAAAPAGYWLSFLENGNGASYTPPQFIKNGASTRKPSDPVRTGYVFGGWYTEEACSADTLFTFGRPLEERTVLYAKWTPEPKAGYTVLIWKQNIACDGYDFVESIPLTGDVNTNISTVTQQGSGNAAYARVNGTNKQYTGFYLKSFDRNVRIVPEGTAVLNVYYDRVEYTITIRNPRGTSIVRTITAKYQQDISGNFPIAGYEGYVLDPVNSSIFTTGQVPFLDIMPAENTVFNLYTYGGSMTYHMIYYFEALPTDTNTVTYNGTRYVLHIDSTVKAGYGLYSTKSEDFIDFVGFTQKESNPPYGFSGTTNFDSSNRIHFYYSRNKYPILYMDGVYVDGDGFAQKEANRGRLHTSDAEWYNSDITSYNKGGADYYQPAYAGYSFSGWFIDEACTQPYTFTTMPEGGIKVFAKWVRTQYRVFLHPNVPESDSSLDWGGQKMCFRVDFGDKIAGGSMIRGTRDNYEIIGWYRDEACTDPFDFSSYVLNDSTVTAAYDQKESTERNKYGNPTENKNEDALNKRTWITKKLDLYAKWREVLVGARGIDVVYDAVEGKGSSAPADPNQYPDNTEAIAQAASVPLSQNEQFLYWVVQTWSDGAFRDTERHVYPGDPFIVLKSDAREEDIEPTEEYPDVFRKYTVQLRAEYGPRELPTLTHINWYQNDGVSADPVHSDTDLQINEAADIYTLKEGIPERKGYVFLGWARKPEYKIFADGVPVGGAVTFYPDLKESDLYLKYDADKKTYQAKNASGSWADVTQVAADEKLPYHGMYAVWKAGSFYVYHSGQDASQTMETITWDDKDARWNKDHTFNLTGSLTDGTLYGGYCDEAGNLADKDFSPANVTLPKNRAVYDGSNWTWSTMATAPGHAVEPEIGHTYVIKEVPDRYLAPKTFTYYKKATDILQQMYLISIIDDTNYSQVGFTVTIGSGKSEDRKEAVAEGSTVYKSFTVGMLAEETDDNGNITYKYDADSPGQVFKPSYGFGKEYFDTDDYMYVNQLFASETACAAQAGRTVTVIPFWITEDAQKTDAVTKRTLRLGQDNKYSEVIFNTSPNTAAAVAPQSAGTAGREMRVVESAVLGADPVEQVLFDGNEEAGRVLMHRLYNPNSGEHFYTGSVQEKAILLKAGWKDEAVAWYAPLSSATPVYRLYNPNAGDHHYTVDAAERDFLTAAGWSYEGIGWYSDDGREVPLYRLYNPNAYLAEGGSGAHHYTVSEEERDSLAALGWQKEGISWYGVEVNG